VTDNHQWIPLEDIIQDRPSWEEPGWWLRWIYLVMAAMLANDVETLGKLQNFATSQRNDADREDVEELEEVILRDHGEAVTICVERVAARKGNHEAIATVTDTGIDIDVKEITP